VNKFLKFEQFDVRLVGGFFSEPILIIEKYQLFIDILSEILILHNNVTRKETKENTFEKHCSKVNWEFPHQRLFCIFTEGKMSNLLKVDISINCGGPG